MKNLTLVILFIFSSICINAQDINFKDFKWEKEPKLHELTAEEAALPEIEVFRETANEFIREDELSYSYFFIHKIVRVNSDDAIGANNKIYIPTGKDVEVLETKARVINSRNVVFELGESAIKEAVDEESKKSYKYFALEGIDKGSEIEYYYLSKREANYSGTQMTFQSEVPIKKMTFEIIAPKHLVFSFKSINGFPEMQKDEKAEEKNRWFVEVDNLPELKDETMSAYEASLQGLVYKLSENTYTGKNNLYSYSTVAQNYYSNTNQELSKKAAKSVKALIKKLRLENYKTDEEKIRALEQYIKTNITYQAFNHPNLDDLEFILSNNISSKLGFMRLYTACFNLLDISHSYVITTNRYENKFDKKFESYSYLDVALIYFPEFDKYLAPAAVLSRLGYIPSPYTNNYGLFIKPLVVGNFKSAIGKIELIEALPHEKNSDTMLINVRFEDDLVLPEISFSKSQMGLDVLSLQPIYDFIEGETEEKLDENLAKFINQDLNVEDVKVENKGGANFGLKPLIVSAKLKETDVFVEKAGTKYLFKIGDLIGPQIEMYQEEGEERKLGIEMTYNHSYYRTIKFNIPEGYQIKNLDDLNFDVSFTYKDKKSSYFISSYSVNGNEVTMTNIEVYDEMFYPRENFPAYQKVINAAADFNKVTLIMEKI